MSLNGRLRQGLISCALAVSRDGKTPMYFIADIERVYTERGKEIFPQRNWLNRMINKVTSLKDPKYSHRGLDKVLKELLGPMKMTDCLKPIFVTTYDLNHNEAILFKSRKAQKDPSCNVMLYDICRATSAGPTYLPAYEFKYEN
jgi:patatin-like phospholipase/acyl hydrolase